MYYIILTISLVIVYSVVEQINGKFESSTSLFRRCHITIASLRTGRYKQFLALLGILDLIFWSMIQYWGGWM